MESRGDFNTDSRFFSAVLFYILYIKGGTFIEKVLFIEKSVALNRELQKGRGLNF